MKKSALLLTTLALGVTSAFAAPSAPTPMAAPTSPTAPVSPATSALAKSAPSMAQAKPALAPTPSTAPSHSAPALMPATPVKGAAPSAAVTAPAAPAEATAAPAVRKGKHKTKKRKPKAKAVATQPSEHVPSAYEVAVAERAARHAHRERQQAAARWSQVETTGCAFMGPVYEKIASAVGARYQVELPSTAGGTPSKLTTTAPWLTAKQEGNQLVVWIAVNEGEFRRAHVALETPGVFCDVVVHQAAASN